MNTKIIFPDKWNNANPDKSTIVEILKGYSTRVC